MIDLFEYESLRTEELPQDFIDEILKKLTTEKLYLQKDAIEIDKMKDGDFKKACKRWHELRYTKHQGAIDFLSEIGLHPAWNWIGHRDEYIFPSYEDCLIQEDWLWQCMDRGE